MFSRAPSAALEANIAELSSAIAIVEPLITALHRSSALLDDVDGSLNTRGFVAIDVHFQVVGPIVDGTFDSDPIVTGIANATLGVDDDGATLGHVCGGGDVEGVLEELTRFQGGE